tara:strand:- start:274 stop:426 length:153 start_codon:yes stop_codon:yes gene_type:complete
MNKRDTLMNIEVNHQLYESLVKTQERYAKVVAMLVVSVIINIAFVLEIII